VLEYILYQTLIGAWPLEGPDAAFAERMETYAIKAAREGKVETSWINPDEGYEAGVKRFVRRILDPAGSAEFIASFDRLARRTALLGALNSLSQLTLKTTMPGVPDFYQGTEFWDLSLVDPDNRRPVDFSARAAALEELEIEPDWAALAAAWPDGRIKLALTRHLLALRNEYAALFAQGTYRPLEVSGPHRDHVVAFARTAGRDAVVVAVGRLFSDLTRGGIGWPAAQDWNAELVLDGFSHVYDTLAPDRVWPGPAMPVSRLFDPLPVAILRASLTHKATTRRRPVDSPGEPAVAD
jgi:(1->4)-alpha-D-glucan 1-alpha-D-glucosylmutase